MIIGELILNFILVTFLGLLIAFNPSLIIVNLFLVLKSKKPIRDTLILVAGLIVPLLVVTLICVFWLKPDSTFHIRGALPDIHIPPLIDLLFGLSLLVYASMRYYKHRMADTQPQLSDKAKRAISSPSSIFTFALIRSSLSITNLLAVVMIAKTLAINKAGPLADILVVAWAIGIGIAPLLVTPYIYERSPQSLKGVQKFIDRVLAHGSGTTGSIILAIIGLGFLIHGASQVSGGN